MTITKAIKQSIAALCGVALLASPAMAQTVESDGSALGFTTTSCTTTGPTTTAVGLTVLIIWAVSPSSANDHMQRYLNENRADVEASLRMPNGATQDLAQLFGVPEQHANAFGALMRAQRTEMATIVETQGAISHEQAGQFIQIVRDGMASHPALSAHLARWTAIQG